MVSITDNEIKMLQIIRRNPGSTKSELATRIQMPWSSAHSIISKVKDKLEIAVDDNNSTYKAELFLDHNYEYYIGVSIGSSQIKIVVLGFDFAPVTLSNIKSENRAIFEVFRDKLISLKFQYIEGDVCRWCVSTPDNIEVLREILISLCVEIKSMKDSGMNVTAINFALPGYIDFYKQEIISTLNLCSNTDYVKKSKISRLITTTVFEQLIKQGIKIYIDHNVKVSAIAEKEYRFVHYNDDSRFDDLMVVYLGYGVGASMILNGTLYRDKENLSGQLGEVMVSYDGVRDKLGCTIRKIINKVSDNHNPSASELKKILSLKENDCIKKSLVNVLSQAISDLIQVIYVKEIVCSGKLNEILDLIENDLNQELENMGIFGVHFNHSAYGECSAAVGAAMGCFYNKYDIKYIWS